MASVPGLSLAHRLAGTASLAVLTTAALPIVATSLTQIGGTALTGLALATGLIGAGALFVAFAQMLKPLDAVRDDLSTVSRDLAAHDMFSRAQNSLDRNLVLLREALYASGQPRQVGDQLFFGDVRINGDFAAVDHVRRTAGGTATVFLGDQRISTNVTKADGTRAIGTQLAKGPVYDAVLGEARGFRGEADILDEAYFTIYEPLISEGRAIGILFVGVKKSEFSAQLEALENQSITGDVTARLARSTAIFRDAATSQATAEREAIRLRQAAEDVRRRQEMDQQTAALAQNEVVDALSSALSRLSAGDLSQDITETFPPEYLRLRTDFNSAYAGLREALGDVADGCRTMKTGAEEISYAADDMAQRTERQAATLEETAAALDQITGTARTTAQAATDAGAMVVKAREQAERSGEVVTQAAAAMQRIQDTSLKIGDIIMVVDEIAMQTNLLALNAAVEAARAGEAGRGFAVVAGEVGSLAKRSTEAAKQIKALVHSSAQEVAGGVAIVHDTGSALASIAAAVVQINDVIDRIAEDAREQSRSLVAVNNAIGDMDRVTQQNAAMVEQSTAASHMLAQESDRLAQSVDRFDIVAVTPVGTSRLAA